MYQIVSNLLRINLVEYSYVCGAVPNLSQRIFHKLQFIQTLETNTRKSMEFTKEKIVEGVVGPWNDYCDGYGNSLSSGNSYVSVLSLSTAVIDTSIDLSPQLRAIVAFDMAEAGSQSNSAYIGQINLLHVSISRVKPSDTLA